MGNQVQTWDGFIQEAEASFKKMNISGAVHWATEANFARQVLEKSSALGKTKPGTIRDAIVNVAAIGLTLNPAEHLAYLVPRGGVCVLDISYRGLIKLATDTGSILWARAELVYSSDEFTHNGPARHPDHKSDPFAKDRGEFVGVYCIARTAEGDYLTEVMSDRQIQEVKAASAAKTGPWIQWFEEMAKKAVIKRASKTWPRTEKTKRLDTAISLLNEHEGLTHATELVCSDDQVLQIEAAIDERGVDMTRIKRAMGVDSLHAIPEHQFHRVMDIVKRAAA